MSVALTKGQKKRLKKKLKKLNSQKQVAHAAGALISLQGGNSGVKRAKPLVGDYHRLANLSPASSAFLAELGARLILPEYGPIRFPDSTYMSAIYLAKNITTSPTYATVWNGDAPYQAAPPVGTKGQIFVEVMRSCRSAISLTTGNLTTISTAQNLGLNDVLAVARGTVCFPKQPLEYRNSQIWPHALSTVAGASGAAISCYAVNTTALLAGNPYTLSIVIQGTPDSAIAYGDSITVYHGYYNLTTGAWSHNFSVIAYSPTVVSAIPVGNVALPLGNTAGCFYFGFVSTDEDLRATVTVRVQSLVGLAGAPVPMTISPYACENTTASDLVGIDKLSSTQARVVSQGLLITSSASAVNDAGDSAIARVPPYYNPCAVPSIYTCLSRNPYAEYHGKLKEGDYGWALPFSPQEMEYRALDSNTLGKGRIISILECPDYTQPHDVIISVFSGVEHISEEPSYEYARTLQPVELNAFMHWLAMVPACSENPVHKDLGKLFNSLMTQIKNKDNWRAAGKFVGTHVLPSIAAMAAAL